MPETTQVNVKLPVSMKREWEDYVEESEQATSLSHLVRLAVQREISDETRPAEVEVSTDDVELDVNIEGIEQRLDGMEDTLTEVRDTVTALETGRLADEEQIEDIADRIYDTIPQFEPKDEESEGAKPRALANDLVRNADTYMAREDKNIEDLANDQNFDYGILPVYKEYFGVNDYEIQKAIERVQQYSNRIHVFDDLKYTVIFETE